MGYTSIQGSIEADKEAKRARDSDELDALGSVEQLRQDMLHACARLLMQISNLLSPRNGPSPRLGDRLSSVATANQVYSDEELETTFLSA